MTDPVESSYSVLTAALVSQVKQRPNIVDDQVLVLDYLPVNVDDMCTPKGTYEVIAMGEGNGVFDDVVFTDGGLRFDETLDITAVIEVLGTESKDSSPVVKRRVNQLVYELFAEIAVQVTWDQTALGLDVFDYVIFTPAAQRWSPGRLQQEGVYACACEITLEAKSRRNFL